MEILFFSLREGVFEELEASVYDKPAISAPSGGSHIVNLSYSFLWRGDKSGRVGLRHDSASVADLLNLPPRAKAVPKTERAPPPAKSMSLINSMVSAARLPIPADST